MPKKLDFPLMQRVHCKQPKHRKWDSCLNDHFFPVAIQRRTRLPQLLTNYGIQWAVLGILRLWYTFREHDITSKTDAGRYALTHLPVRWHPLIQEAINLRDAPEQRFYKSRVCRAWDAVQFLRYIIQLCNQYGSLKECSP